MAPLGAKDGRMTLFVATCQREPSQPPDALFKAVKFPAQVPSCARLEAVQHFLLTQWAITKSPYADIPPEEQYYTFKGRLLRLDGTLDGYYIADQDTIYLRFASLGPICDPCAMSTSELRVELKARNAYETKLQPEQLMLRLQEEVMKESRMQRLQKATKNEQLQQVQEITRELEQFQLKIQKRNVVLLSANASWSSVPRPASLAWPHAPSPNRTVFLSITDLEQTYQSVPRDVLEPALFIFDTERKWVFDPHNSLQKQQFDYKYMCFDHDFLEMLTLKEESGMVFWFRPQKSYEKLSAWLTEFEDLVTRKKFSPLALKLSMWLTLCGTNGWEGKERHDGRKPDTTKIPQFTKSIARVTTNLQSQSFDYLAVQEILYQANPTLLFAPLK